MSIRAYRINNIELEKDPTFNLWHDEEIRNFLYSEGCFETFGEETGQIEVSVETWEKALKEIKGLDKATKKAIQKDIDWANSKSIEDYILYYCF